VALRRGRDSVLENVSTIGRIGLNEVWNSSRNQRESFRCAGGLQGYDSRHIDPGTSGDFVCPAGRGQAPVAAPNHHPDFGGIWNSATATPLERPARLNDKAFFTPEEAGKWERQVAAQNQDSSPQAVSKNVGTYNVAFREFGAHVVKTLRTAIITDPPDGRIPALTPAAAAAKRRRQELLRNPSGAQDLGLQDQCLIFPTAVPPMIPYSYNGNYQIIQTQNELMVHVEMIHDTRIIPLDGRPHLPPDVRLWLGDSVGH
jgi:hypothetical protein